MGARLDLVLASLAILSDPSCLRHVMQNLIGNVIQTTDRGRVSVGARNGDAARTEVRDSGIGIAEADQRAIFQEFRQLRASRCRNR